MSEKRMFAKSITESDAFLDLPFSAQALYFHMAMNADDEGFINSSRRVCAICGATEADLKLLVEKSFLIRFESGIFVIKHWKINNKIRADRAKKTNYPEEKAMLIEKENGGYSLITDDKKEVEAHKESELTAEATSEPFDEVDERTQEEIERQEQFEYESQAEPRKDFAETIFDILFTANLPCRAKNVIAFSMGDFRLGLTELSDLHLSSSDVIQALKNYVEVVKLKRAGLSWWTSEQDFYSFCKSKTILKFIPGNFKIENYMKNAENSKADDDKIQL